MIPLVVAFAACRCASAEREFIEKLYLDNHELMYVVARRYARDEADVDDIVSTSVMKLIAHVQKLMSLECHACRAYVVITVKHAGIDHVRCLRRTATNTDKDLIENIPIICDFDGGILSDERLHQLRSALKYVGERNRQLLEMKYFLEYDDETIAKYMDVKPESVRQMLRRARMRLALEMEKYENGYK